MGFVLFTGSDNLIIMTPASSKNHFMLNHRIIKLNILSFSFQGLRHGQLFDLLFNEGKENGDSLKFGCFPKQKFKKFMRYLINSFCTRYKSHGLKVLFYEVKVPSSDRCGPMKKCIHVIKHQRQ